LRTHQEEWVRAKLGDRILGFADEELKRMLLGAGLRDVKVGVGARKSGDPFTVLIASGQKAEPQSAQRPEPPRPQRPEPQRSHRPEPQRSQRPQRLESHRPESQRPQRKKAL